MKSIATVNTSLPSVGSEIKYGSGDSLRDFDIILFDPRFPYDDRIHFDAGGSCLSIEATHRMQSAIRHWNTELTQAIKSGKTVFIILDEMQKDLGANSSSLVKNQRNYHTVSLNNYEAIPVQISARNTKGQQIIVADSTYRGLYDALKEVARYRVILESENGKKIFTAKDGTPISSVVEFKDMSGKMILLPYFNLNEYDKNTSTKWSAKALAISNKIANQLVSTDTFFQKRNGQTPAPEWLGNVEKSKIILKKNKVIESINVKINALEQLRQKELESKESFLEFSQLLYENGKLLEMIIERSLQLLGYKVENFRSGDLEIDHIIISPDGKRMIGESEGKDTSAIDITKFRQLESNINEDFQRDEIDMPARGILFGNGFRFKNPNEREEQFTTKCLTNSKRLGTTLVRTADLYRVVVCVLDNPKNEKFKAACRQAIDEAVGEIVTFPLPL